jgi:hypothetical protein
MTPHDTLPSANPVFLSFPAFSSGNRKTGVSLAFPLRKRGVAGGGIEPPSRFMAIFVGHNWSAPS